MKFYKIKKDEVFVKSEFGVEEPEDNLENIINKDSIDVMIIPGVCFDRYNNRLGFGKGYYDKYMNGIKAYKIGICFKEQITKDILPHDSYDVRLDEIICD